MAIAASEMEEDRTEPSRFFSTLQIDPPITALKIDGLSEDRECNVEYDAKLLMQTVYYVDSMKKLLVCLANNMEKPRTLEAHCPASFSELEKRLDDIGREHHELWKRNKRSSKIVDAFRKLFREQNKQQLKVLDDIYECAKEMRVKNQEREEKLKQNVAEITNTLEKQRLHNEDLCRKLKEIEAENYELGQQYAEIDLQALDTKMQYIIRGDDYHNNETEA